MHSKRKNKIQKQNQRKARTNPLKTEVRSHQKTDQTSEHPTPVDIKHLQRSQEARVFSHLLFFYI